jgi:Bacterial Ig domain
VSQSRSCWGLAGPRGGQLAANTTTGVQVTAPAGIAIREAKVWWAVPHQQSGADTYALTAINGGLVGETTTPIDTLSSFTLPSSTTTLVLADYCANDDVGNPCVLAGGNALEFYGSQLTLEENTPPTGRVTGGGLTGTGALTGTQSISYTAEDTVSGIRRTELLIDGQPAATSDFGSQCAYSNFLACPASESAGLSWNTASVADGQHSIQLKVQDAAQNTATVYSATITTHNAPADTLPPTLQASSQLIEGSAISVQAGTWSTPAGAGATTYTYRWEACDSSGENCTTIAGAEAASYTPTTADIGHTLRALIIATDSWGCYSSRIA